MSDVIVMKGAIQYKITLDPSVWIFDERKIDLATFTGELTANESDQQAYIKGTGAQWDKEMAEGAQLPSASNSMMRARKALEGDYAMPLAPFIKNAEPHSGVSHVRIHRANGDSVTVSLADANQAILQFSKDGKPLRDRGPAYLYLPDTWKQKQAPIDQITAFEFLE